MRQGFVYILTDRRNGTLYTGVTSDLRNRVDQHRRGLIEGFTKKYNLRRLVWYEVHTDMREAIIREKRIKAWRRRWKVRMIEDVNPEWDDLFEGIR